MLLLIGKWGIPPSAALTCYQVCVPCVFPFHEAVQVLNLFRDQFIEKMDANAVVWELLHRGCISEGDKNKLIQFDEPRQCNQFLHWTLVQKCTEEAFETVCDIITTVKGNPKMKALGESMKRRLETGGYMWGEGRLCALVHVHGCVCVWECCVQCAWMCVSNNCSQSLLYSAFFALQLRSLQTCPQYRHLPAPKLELPLLTRDPPQRWSHCLQHSKVCSMQCHYTRVHLTVYRVWEVCQCMCVQT